MQRHWDIEIERIIVANADDKKHSHQRQVVFEGNFRLSCAAFRCEQEAFECNEEELQERD